MACLEFEHSAGANLTSYSEHFDCPLRFGARHNATLFSAEHLDRPVSSFDPSLHRRLENELSERLRTKELELDLSKSVKAWISARLCRSASIDIRDAAGDFGMSVRSFQRTLSDAGLSYADLRNSVRTEIAKAMLARTGLSIFEIAVNLGYRRRVPSLGASKASPGRRRRNSVKIQCAPQRWANATERSGISSRPATNPLSAEPNSRSIFQQSTMTVPAACA
jgi:AraC-like DNA-binding protein